MNTKLVDSLVELIQSLSTEERSLLETKLNGRSQPTPVTTPQKRLSEFYGALPATQSYPGKEAIRSHDAFPNGYVSEDEGLYDNYPTE